MLGYSWAHWSSLDPCTMLLPPVGAVDTGEISSWVDDNYKKSSPRSITMIVLLLNVR
jgi:hypothetical protein